MKKIKNKPEANLAEKGDETKKAKEHLLPEVNIGLVGHVDHGKTSLTEALSGKWTDTHSEELKRGVTIKIGYADVTIYKCPECEENYCYTTTEKCQKHMVACKPERTISLVDAPGHETLMATVLSGASLMDGAILLIAANEECPQPQTREHLVALNISGIKNIVIAQNKIDLVSEEQIKKNYEQIKNFVKGTIAENAPIIPISAAQRVNIDALVKAIQESIPTPKVDTKKESKLLVVRTFDVNKPGTKPEKLLGGVIGGSIIQGELKINEDIEIRPGIKIEKENKTFWKPLITKIYGIQQAGINIDKAKSGGLVGILTGLDPYLTKSDSLAGSVVGHPNKLPDVLDKLMLETYMLENVVGVKERLKVEQIRTGETLMLNIGPSRTVGTVISARKNGVEISLKIPVCATKGNRVAISRQISQRWRLIGYGIIK